MTYSGRSRGRAQTGTPTAKFEGTAETRRTRTPSPLCVDLRPRKGRGLGPAKDSVSGTKAMTSTGHAPSQAQAPMGPSEIETS